MKKKENLRALKDGALIALIILALAAGLVLIMLPGCRDKVECYTCTLYQTTGTTTRAVSNEARCMTGDEFATFVNTHSRKTLFSEFQMVCE